MDRIGSWFLSAAIHAALLLGALTVVEGFPCDPDVAGGGDESGFSCSFRDPGWTADRIERPVDSRVRSVPSSEVPDLLAESYSAPLIICNLRPCNYCVDGFRGGKPCPRCSPTKKSPGGKSGPDSNHRFFVQCGNELFDKGLIDR